MIKYGLCWHKISWKGNYQRGHNYITQVILTKTLSQSRLRILYSGPCQMVARCAIDCMNFWVYRYTVLVHVYLRPSQKPRMNHPMPIVSTHKMTFNPTQDSNPCQHKPLMLYEHLNEDLDSKDYPFPAAVNYDENFRVTLAMTVNMR